MDVRVGDILVMKKKHPCGEDRFLVLRSGMDFRIRCNRCGRELMIARAKCEKNIKSIQHVENGANECSTSCKTPKSGSRRSTGC